MKKSNESLLSYIKNLDFEKEFESVDFEEIEEWMTDEWSELNGVSPDEATSIIIDGNYKWMHNNANRNKFVFEKLMELNSDSKEEVLEYLKGEINKLEPPAEKSSSLLGMG